MASNWRATALPYLTTTAHVSAPFITTFLLIHLSAPALANIGGSSLSSKTMLLGREYYQTTLTEPLLILGPITIHALSAIAKRLLSSPPSRPPRKLSTLHSITGYTTFLFFLPIHFLVHRANPTNPAPPIYAVGPSELDYEYVKYGLHTWPWRSWFLYGGLVLSTALHFVEGVAIITNTYDWLADSVAGAWKRTSRNRRVALALGVIVLPVLSGVYALAKEPMMLFASKASQYQASFTSSLVYRI